MEPNVFLTTSLDLINRLAETNPGMKETLGKYVAKIKTIRDLKTSDINSSGLVNSTKSSNPEFLRNYKIRKSVALDKSISKFLMKQSKTSQVGGGNWFSSLYGFGNGFKYKGAFSQSIFTGHSAFAWNGIIGTMMLVGWGVGSAFSNSVSMGKFLTNSKPKLFLKTLIRDHATPIRCFTRTVLITGLTKNGAVIEMMENSSITSKSYAYLDSCINRLSISRARFQDIQVIITILMGAYLYKCGNTNITDEVFSKFICICVGGGVNNDVLAASDVFEIKYTLDNVRQNSGTLPIPKEEYLLIVGNMCLRFQTIRARWYSHMDNKTKESFNFIDEVMEASKDILTAHRKAKLNDFSQKPNIKF